MFHIFFFFGGLLDIWIKLPSGGWSSEGGGYDYDEDYPAAPANHHSAWGSGKQDKNWAHLANLQNRKKTGHSKKTVVVGISGQTLIIWKNIKTSKNLIRQA